MRPSPHQALVRLRSLISPHAFLRRMSLPGSAHHQRSSDILTMSDRDAPRDGSLWTGRRMWECFHVLRLSYYLIPGAESRVEDTTASNSLLVSQREMELGKHFHNILERTQRSLHLSVRRTSVLRHTQGHFSDSEWQVVWCLSAGGDSFLLRGECFLTTFYCWLTKVIGTFYMTSFVNNKHL